MIAVQPLGIRFLFFVDVPNERADERRDKAAAEPLEKGSAAAPQPTADVPAAMASEPATDSSKEAENPENLRKFERKACAGTLKA